MRVILNSPRTAGNRVAEDFNPTINIPSIASLWDVKEVSDGISSNGCSAVVESSRVANASKAFRRSVKNMITAARLDISPGS